MSGWSSTSGGVVRQRKDALATAQPVAPQVPARAKSERSARRPRVLVLAQLPPPEHGASAVNRQVVNSALLTASFDLQVVPISMTEELGRIRRFELAKIGRSLRLYWTVARRLFGPTRPDLIYFSLSPVGWAFYRDIVLVALFRLAGVRHLFHLHGRGIADSVRKAPSRKFLYQFAFAHAFVITLGGLLSRDIEGLADPERVFIVPNGVRDQSGTDRHPRREEERKPGPPRILFLSNMLEEKGPLVLLEALALLAARGIPFEARFAGPWRGSLSSETFSAQVLALGLEAHVAHLGPLYGAAKTKAFAEADIFALPTYYENEALPLAVIEAMMHGLPVVTTEIGALPEIVIDRESGELTEPGNVRELAAALERMLLNPDLRARYGRAARAIYESTLTDGRFEERLAEVLSRVARHA